MGTRSVIDIQKKGIMIHKLIYVMFFFQKLSFQFEVKNGELRDTYIILGLALLCAGADFLFFYYNFFNKIRELRILRYAQCIITMCMIAFSNNSVDSILIILALLVMYLLEFLLSMEITDRESALLCVISVGLPFAVLSGYRMLMYPTDLVMFLIFDVVLFVLVMSMSIFEFADFMEGVNQRILNQQNELTRIVEKNEEILNMQDKIHNTNMLLNIQKLDLQSANKQIKEANAEMIAQAEILHYIAMSFEVPKISNQITDAIMRVKRLGFCAVYIEENAYLNKHANYVIKTDIALLQSKIKENIEDIYKEMVVRNEKEEVDHENLKKRFPFLRNVNINSVYIKVLGQDDEIYGLFMIGDERKNLFGDNMSFYDAIIAQYDIAISNARIYNEMQNMARKDGLTGINNRIYFTQLFKESIEKIIQSNGCISVALFDIDKFKNVNDTYGHLAGDEVIKKIASAAEQCIDKYNGFVCRYGGEEFVAVLPERKLEIAQPIIQELFEVICSQVVYYDEWQIHMSVSVGLTAYPEVCINPDDLLKRADWCMYYAKEHGRHQICVDDGSIQKD